MSRITAVFCILVLLLAAPAVSAVVAVPVGRGILLAADVASNDLPVPDAPRIAHSLILADSFTLRGPPHDLLPA